MLVLSLGSKDLVVPVRSIVDDQRLADRARVEFHLANHIHLDAFFTECMHGVISIRRYLCGKV